MKIERGDGKVEGKTGKRDKEKGRGRGEKEREMKGGDGPLSFSPNIFTNLHL